MNIDNSECLKNFGTFIKDAREKQNLFQADVAEQIGISQAFYSHIERGLRNVDLVMAMKICKVLKLNLSNYIKQYL